MQLLGCPFIWTRANSRITPTRSDKKHTSAGLKYTFTQVCSFHVVTPCTLLPKIASWNPQRPLWFNLDLLGQIGSKQTIKHTGTSMAPSLYTPWLIWSLQVFGYWRPLSLLNLLLNLAEGPDRLLAHSEFAFDWPKQHNSSICICACYVGWLGLHMFSHNPQPVWCSCPSYIHHTITHDYTASWSNALSTCTCMHAHHSASPV